jgi:sulfonate transport system substrate-binding protein
MLPTSRRRALGLAAAAVATLAATGAARAADLPSQVTLDWAYYNPVSLVLKGNGWLEEELRPLGVGVRWVQSLGSNKALEFLNAGSIDLGSTAGAAALLGRINGNPIRSVYVYSKPEWTALVTRPDTGIASVPDLKGRRIAVTKGTDPYIFLLRALDRAGLGQGDVQLVLIQHDQGRLALERGDVDAWAGLDPMMAATELEAGNRLFFRDPDANSYGVLNVREAFLAEQPDLVARVLAVYERGRRWALENKPAVVEILAEAAKLPAEVARKQIGERTDLSNPRIEAARPAILDAGKALQGAGVIKPEVDVEAQVDALIDTRFSAQLAAGGQ